MHAPLDQVVGVISGMPHHVEEVTDSHSHITLGGDSAEELAVWLAGFPLPFELLGDDSPNDDAVLDAVRRLGAKLTRACVNPLSRDEH